MKNLLTILILLSLSLSIAPGSQTGDIYGELYNQKGDLVIDGRVKIKDTEIKALITYKGTFHFYNLAPGTYELYVEAFNYIPKILVVTVYSGKTTRVATKLWGENLTTKETHDSSKAMLYPDEVGESTAIKQTEMAVQPGIIPMRMTSLIPSVILTGSGYGILGMDPGLTRYRLNGFDIGNQFDRTHLNMWLPLPSDWSIEEIKTYEGGYSVETGNAGASYLDVITPDGMSRPYSMAMRFGFEFAALNGSSPVSYNVNELDGRLSVDKNDDSRKLMSSGEQTFDYSLGARLPFFHQSSIYFNARYHKLDRIAGLDIDDGWGNNLGEMPDNDHEFKNLNGKIRFGFNKNTSLLVNAFYGITNYLESDWVWLYANDYGMIDDEEIRVPERIAKQAAVNNIIQNYALTFSHRTGDYSWLEFDVGYSSYEYMSGKQRNVDIPLFYEGYDIVTPEDKFMIGRENGENLFIEGRDRILDRYQSWSELQTFDNGHFVTNINAISPLTGYREMHATAVSTKNPYGLSNIFFNHGNTSRFYFYQTQKLFGKGRFKIIFPWLGGDHRINAGFEFDFFMNHKHFNHLPWDGNPLFDVFTDYWGGNIYTDNKDFLDRASKPISSYFFGIYAEDQFSVNNMIVTFGLRYDSFTPSTDSLPVWDEGVNWNGMKLYPSKNEISPRINVVYEISDHALVRVSAGRYVEIPYFNSIYNGLLGPLRGVNYVLTPDIDLIRTMNYGAGWRHEIIENYTYDISFFYNESNFDGYVTGDELFGSKGISLSLLKRRENNHSFRLNYTWQESDYKYYDYNYYSRQSYTHGWKLPQSINGSFTFFLNFNEGLRLLKSRIFENMDFTFDFMYLIKDGKRLFSVDAGYDIPNYFQTNLMISKKFSLEKQSGNAMGTYIELSIGILNLLNNTNEIYPVEENLIGNIEAISTGSVTGANPWYKEGDFRNMATYRSDQYDDYGNRLYSEVADLNKDDKVSQEERFIQYGKYMQDVLRQKQSFQLPRRFLITMAIHF
jgi:hypothetical protein